MRNSKQRITVSSILAVCALILAFGVLRPAGASAAGSSVLGTVSNSGTGYIYTDASGDNASAPDIQKVTLSDGSDGTIGVEIDLAATIPNDSSNVILGIDADRNSNTGSSGGLEYAVITDAEGAGILKWDGANFSAFDHHPVSPNLVGGRLTFTLTVSDLGLPTAFDFVVVSTHGNDADAAPENGVFTYPQTETKPTIQSILLNLWALVPKAGKTLAIPSVQVKLSTNKIVTADSLACTLTYNGRALHPIGTCAWKLPKTYRKKHLVLKLTATYQGASSTITLPISPR